MKINYWTKRRTKKEHVTENESLLIGKERTSSQTTLKIVNGKSALFCRLSFFSNFSSQKRCFRGSLEEEECELGLKEKFKNHFLKKGKQMYNRNTMADGHRFSQDKI